MSVLTVTYFNSLKIKRKSIKQIKNMSAGATTFIIVCSK